jgi:hypothetical protein
MVFPNFNSFYNGFQLNEDVQYVYTPDNLTPTNEFITNDKYIQGFEAMIDKISYNFLFIIDTGTLTIEIKLNQPTDNVNDQDSTFIYKLFSTINDILNKYVKPRAIKMGDVDIVSIIINPAIDLSNKAIELAKRNRIYDNMMKTVIFNDNVEYKLSYDDNNLVFKIINEVGDKSSLKISEL